MDRDDRRSGERDERVSAPAGPPVAKGMSGVAYAGLGFQFAAALVVFFYLGQWLDQRFGTAPVLLLTCVLVGSGTAFYAMYRQLMTAQRRDQAARAATRVPRAGDSPESRP